MRLLSCFFLVVGFVGTALASDADGSISAEAFYALTTKLMIGTGTHDKAIEDCAAKGFLNLDKADLSVLETALGVPPEQAAREVCRRLVKGIASGDITFSTYTRWMDDGGPALIPLPDYK